VKPVLLLQVVVFVQKLAKLAKRKRDEDDKAKRNKRGDKEEEREVELAAEESRLQELVGEFAVQRMKLKEALARYV
jgi:hypothetical protein